MKCCVKGVKEVDTEWEVKIEWDERGEGEGGDDDDDDDDEGRKSGWGIMEGSRRCEEEQRGGKWRGRDGGVRGTGGAVEEEGRSC